MFRHKGSDLCVLGDEGARHKAQQRQGCFQDGFQVRTRFYIGRSSCGLQWGLMYQEGHGRGVFCDRNFLTTSNQNNRRDARPETDLDAYAVSVRRLAALAPQAKVVMGAHNIPVASPTLLPKLVAAFDAVRAGKVQPLPDSPGKVLYKVDDISFQMRAAPGGPPGSSCCLRLLSRVIKSAQRISSSFPKKKRDAMNLIRFLARSVLVCAFVALLIGRAA